MTWEFATDPEFERELAWMRAFVREEIYPLETLDLDWYSYRHIIRPLQDEVKRRGLWAAHLSPELGGQGFGQVKLALVHEILGGSELAPPVFGNQAPDSGNSELLAIVGTPEQKKRWLEPLLAGELYSAFSMTESGTGSEPPHFSTDLPLEEMYRWSRAARIYDGPDEVHRVTVARRTLRGYQSRPVATEHVPTRRAAALRKYGPQLEAAVAATRAKAAGAGSR
jgi:alkylation response protein AidB-like acyl-CoA dehydrogenase